MTHMGFLRSMSSVDLGLQFSPRSTSQLPRLGDELNWLSILFLMPLYGPNHKIFCARTLASNSI